MVVEPSRHARGQHLSAAPDGVMSQFLRGEAEESSVLDCQVNQAAVAVADEGAVGQELVLVAGKVDDPTSGGCRVSELDPAVELQRLITDANISDAVPGSHPQQPRELVQQPGRADATLTHGPVRTEREGWMHGGLGPFLGKCQPVGVQPPAETRREPRFDL